MRLDQFLKVSRLTLRRSVAQELCEAGAVQVNNLPARAARTIRIGDEISIWRHGRILTVRVRRVPETKQVSREAAGQLYEIISDVTHKDSSAY